MRDTWKELQRQEENESVPLAPSCKTMSGSRVISAGQQDEPDLLESGFTWDFLGPGAIKIWFWFQIVSLFFQASLWMEVSGHLSTFQDILSRECPPSRSQHGVCIGPMWNVSDWEDFVLSSSAWANSRTFSFSTRSNPPTFLVVVDPVAKSSDDTQDPSSPVSSDVSEQVDDVNVPWILEVVRTQPPQIGSTFRRSHNGQQAMTFEDMSVETQDHLKAVGKIEWKATLTSKYSKKVRFVAFVEDSATKHLSDIHGSNTCAFGRAWKSFNEQHQGHSHRVLSWCRFLLGIFLWIGGSTVYAVHSSWHTKSGLFSKFRFHLLVMVKFVFMDIPLQICIVLYLFGWYESYGLRCQLCLFHPEHCGDEDPFHMANATAILCTLLSAVCNQLLVRPAYKKSYSEDDICIQYLVRVGGLCVSTLPFTTGMCLASQSLLSLPVTTHIICAVPCGIGWLTLIGSVCFPVCIFCDEDF